MPQPGRRGRARPQTRRAVGRDRSGTGEGQGQRARAPAAACAARTPAQIGERAGKIVNKYKVAKHFTLKITDGNFAYQRKTEQIASEAALDGLYVIRTTLGADRLGTAAAVRAYKQLKMAERAFER